MLVTRQLRTVGNLRVDTRLHGPNIQHIIIYNSNTSSSTPLHQLVTHHKGLVILMSLSRSKYKHHVDCTTTTTQL